ncbi:MAG: hypothetical protein WCA19_02440 [Candidatus Acidiferrales bacterium]
MVIVITARAMSGRNTVGRLLADDLGWEFVVAEDLYPSAHLDARNRNPSLASVTPFSRIETLSAAVNSWINEWRDVVVSCPLLTETDRRQLSEMSSLVKIVCLEGSRAAYRPPLFDRDCPVRAVGSEFPDGCRTARKPEQEALTVDLAHQVEEIIREMVSALVLN